MKKILCWILCISLALGTGFTCYADVSDDISSVDMAAQTIDNGVSEISPNSTLSFYGPLSGAVQRGSVAYRSTNQNLTNATLVISFLASISGCPASKYASTSALVLGLLANNKQNQYYTRTLYYSSDGTMYYYKYNYYKDAGYSSYISTDYSNVFSILY